VPEIIDKSGGIEVFCTFFISERSIYLETRKLVLQELKDYGNSTD
jgi:hypothetical protein